MKHIASINGNALIQDGNMLYVVYDHMYDVNDLSWVKNPDEDLDLEAKVELLSNGQIKVHHLQELYQFNCCGGLLDIIKLLNMVTKENIDLENPAQFPVPDFKNGTYKIDDEKFGATFAFTFKNQNFTGDGTFIKYWFFSGLEDSVSSVKDLMTLYVGLTKLTAKACYEINDDLFLQCDDWIVSQHQSKNGSGYIYKLKPGII